MAVLLLQLLLQSLSSAAEYGAGYKAGPRDEARELRGVFAGRADRALRNMLETFPVFAALALALVVTGRNGGMGALGAEIWVVARVLYVPLYLIQIPFARSRDVVRRAFCAACDAGCGCSNRSATGNGG